MLRMLLRACRPIDIINEKIGEAVRWLVLVAVLIGAGNAVVRYALDTSSNAWLEAQWYLYSAVFLLCAGYTLLRNEHVRIDVISGRLSHRIQAWIDIAGGVLFLMPMVLMITVLSWPLFVKSYAVGEISTDAGGLLRWPVKFLIPLGFFLLSLQGVSQIVKRIAFLAGVAPDPFADKGLDETERTLIDDLQTRKRP